MLEEQVVAYGNSGRYVTSGRLSSCSVPHHRGGIEFGIMASAPSFRFAEEKPDPRLAAWIWRYWEFGVEHGAPLLHHVPPDGATSLLVPIIPGQATAAILSGPWLEPLVLPVVAGSRYIGVRFLPGAAAPFVGVDAETLVNRTRPAANTLGPLAEQLARGVAASGSLVEATRVMNPLLNSHSAGVAHPDERVQRAVTRLTASGGRTAITILSKELGTSQRTLLRWFRAATGLSPKQFARVQRFRSAAMAMVGSHPSLSRVAAEGGYADQPHLTHEFVSLMGLTPAEMQAIVSATRHENLSY